MGTKNIYGEVRINDEAVATQDWAQEKFITNPKPAANSVITVAGDNIGSMQYTIYYPYAYRMYVCADESYGDTISGTGYFLVNDPKKPYHAANKKYVDEAVANAGTGTGQEITFSDELKSVGTISVINKHESDYFMFQIASLVYSIQVGNTIYIGADRTPILVDYIVRAAGRTSIRTKQGVTLPEFTANVGDAVYIQEVSTIDGYLMKDTTAREEIAKIKQHLGIE